MSALELTSSPLVSVLLPAFNAASTILPAIRSILDGDYPNLECIVVDDGSEDDTFRAAKSIQDSRLRIIQQAHQGVAHAHNRAVREARGTWLARMDADDIATPNRLSAQWRFLQEQGCGLIGGGVSIVDMEGTPVKSMKRYQDWLNHLNNHAAIMAQRFVELPIVNPTLFGHRKWFERGCVQGPFPEDYDFFLNVTQDPSLKTGKVDETILFWRDHPERATRTDQRYEVSSFDACKRHHLLRGPLKNQNRVLFWGAGQTGKPWIRWLLSQNRSIDCIIDVDPRKIGQRLHGISVSDPTYLKALSTPPECLLIAVGAQGAREKILAHLLKQGYQPGTNAWFLA